jgi:hypothetical protein
MRGAAEKLEKRVDDVLRRVDFVPAGGWGGSTLYRRNGACYAVETKSMALYRSAEFRAMVGDAILRFQASKAAGQLLLAVRFGRMGGRAESDLLEYAKAYAPGLCWLLLPDRGDAVLYLSGQGRVVIPNDTPAGSNSVSQQAGGALCLFSPKSQWLWKLLLMPGIDSRYWSGCESRPRSVSELVMRSGVSQPAVSSFLGRAERLGFLKRDAGRLTVINHRELLEDWMYASKHMRRQVLGVRPLYSEPSDDGLLRQIREFCARAQQGNDVPPVVVSSHLACHLLGLGRSNQRAAQLRVAGTPVSEIMEALDLVQADERQAVLEIVADGLSDSAHRGCVRVQGVPVADVLQCYLDVRLSHARGYEQSEYIYERVLRPHFERSL